MLELWPGFGPSCGAVTEEDVSCVLSCLLVSSQVVDQKSMKLIRELEEQTPIDVSIGEAISSLWDGESDGRTCRYNPRAAVQ